MIANIVSLCLAVASPAAATDTALVSFELREGERLLGSPALQVRLGEPASVRIAGANGYALTVTVHEAGADYLVQSTFSRPDGDGWRLVASPALQVARGRQGRVVIGGAPAPTYEVAVTVR
jgi:hypothetical protein